MVKFKKEQIGFLKTGDIFSFYKDEDSLRYTVENPQSLKGQSAYSDNVSYGLYRMDKDSWVYSIVPVKPKKVPAKPKVSVCPFKVGDKVIATVKTLSGGAFYSFDRAFTEPLEVEKTFISCEPEIMIVSHPDFPDKTQFVNWNEFKLYKPAWVDITDDVVFGYEKSNHNGKRIQIFHNTILIGELSWDGVEIRNDLFMKYKHEGQWRIQITGKTERYMRFYHLR
jgi:hypothetical protein